MQLLFKRFHLLFIGIMVFILCSVFIVNSAVEAQDDDFGYVIQVTGTLNAVQDSSIIIDGITYPLAPGVTIPSNSIGTVVTITGEFSGNNTIIVVSVTVEQTTATPTAATTDTPATSVPSTAVATVTATPEITGTPFTPTPGATPTPGTVIIEGPVQVININIITIYNTNIWINPTDPMLKKLKKGDWVRVNGRRDNKGMVVATVITTLVNPGVDSTVSLEGVVQAVNGNVITINGINAQLDPNDPILATLKVGDVLSVEGDFEGTGTTFILVVVNVVIINNVNVVVNPDCWWHVTAMGGHWHCDKGMGMGMGGMGMGMGDGGMGMGMGD